MSVRPRRDLQREFWILIRAGASVRDAEIGASLGDGTGKRWFRNAGGMPPISLKPPRAGRYLTIVDRERIAAGLNQELSIRAIARSINKSASTVLHELRNNMHHQQYRSRSSLDPSSAGRPEDEGLELLTAYGATSCRSEGVQAQGGTAATNLRLAQRGADVGDARNVSTSAA